MTPLIYVKAIFLLALVFGTIGWIVLEKMRRDGLKYCQWCVEQYPDSEFFKKSLEDWKEYKWKHTIMLLPMMLLSLGIIIFA